MSDLAGFLLARIDEEENEVETAPVDWGENVFSQARLLAECDAKRRIIELHPHTPRCRGDRHSIHCQTCRAPVQDFEVNADEPYQDFLTRYARAQLEPWPCPTLRLLALPFADHPDYRPEWKP